MSTHDRKSNNLSRDHRAGRNVRAPVIQDVFHGQSSTDEPKPKRVWCSAMDAMALMRYVSPS